MLLNQIKVFAHYHFDNKGWCTTDSNNHTYWYKNKPIFNKTLQVWVNETADTSINSVILVCSKTELIFGQYNRAIFKL